jgi:hypothetical protein
MSMVEEYRDYASSFGADFLKNNILSFNSPASTSIKMNERAGTTVGFRRASKSFLSSNKIIRNAMQTKTDGNADL